VQFTAYGRQTIPDSGVVMSCDPLQNFGGSTHITGTAEPKVVKFCTQVGYINSSNRMTYHQQKGRCYGYVTILKFCCLSWCSASASKAERLTHSAAMSSRAWRAQWPGFDSARARPPTKELFLIIPTHMMNREIITGRKKEGSTVSSINCDRCRQLDLAVSSLPAAPASVKANRLGWPLVGVIHSASQG